MLCLEIPSRSEIPYLPKVGNTSTIYNSAAGTSLMWDLRIWLHQTGGCVAEVHCSVVVLQRPEGGWLLHAHACMQLHYTATKIHYNSHISG